jgi:hypothetical protein
MDTLAVAGLVSIHDATWTTARSPRTVLPATRPAGSELE